MEKQQKGTVILLPRTMEYYQVQLTRMLESERYREAQELLKFLLSCRTDDPQMKEEWEMLLSWMEAEFPTSLFPEGESEEEAMDEVKLLSEQIASKQRNDHAYAAKMLDMLQGSDALDKQMMALEQLAHISDETLDHPLAEWLTLEGLHPLLQYKGLQTLKMRGKVSSARIVKGGQPKEIDLEDVPLQFSEYPRLIQEVLRRVEEVCEMQAPSLSYFAEQVWKEFLALMFGTDVYRRLLMLEEEAVDVWSASLHSVCTELMGEPISFDEVGELYGLFTEDRKRWEQTCYWIRAVFGKQLHT